MLQRWTPKALGVRGLKFKVWAKSQGTLPALGSRTRSRTRRKLDLPRLIHWKGFLEVTAPPEG